MAFREKFIANTPFTQSFFKDLGKAVKSMPKAAGELGSRWKSMLTRKNK